GVVENPGLKPGLDFQAALSPKASVQFLLLSRRQPAKPTGVLCDQIHQRADPRPIRCSQCRRIVAMADMNGRRTGYVNQDSPLERALSSADDQAALVTQLGKSNQVTCV